MGKIRNKATSKSELEKLQAANLDKLFSESFLNVDSSWETEALCAYADPDAFFPEKGMLMDEARMICSECPVVERCLEFALQYDLQEGIWGGLSKVEREKFKKGDYKRAI